jgi:hypothetical protein
MFNSFLARLIIFVFVVLGIALLAVLTMEDDEDPCDNPQADITGAVLGDSDGDQSALTNRAMLQRKRCQRPVDASEPPPEPTPDATDSDQAQEQPPAPAATAPPSSSISTGWSEAFMARAAAATTLPSESVAARAPTTAHDVLAQRCMVCHGCYDAPCQLKLEAHAGTVRGASKDLVYNGSRLVQANMTRLFDDATTEKAWRKKGFYPVVNNEDPESGVMFRMLQLKQAHPLPSEGPIPGSFDFSLYRDQQCPTEEEFDSYASNNPLWGMPYGLPGLNAEEHGLLSKWLLAGAPEPATPATTAKEAALLEQWETLLNREDNKHRLVARYLFEHLFLASLYLEVQGQINWFRIVRSSTPPGEPVQVIATRRPYDAPRTARFYYRLQRMPLTPLAKIHMPYRFDKARLARYRELFIDADYEVASLPGYAPEVASNPFKAFQQIPVNSRYRFLLDEAQFSIMNFIKGPVCRGQVALNVIDDHFWVMFIAPGDLDVTNDADFLARETDNLRLPDPKTGTVVDVFRWRGYAKANENYQRARARYIARETRNHALEIADIWDGDGENNNASLTVFRHFDTASVARGLIGQIPKTAWVIDYSLLERIHYLLVAGFDVYGSVAHQLQSRLYMDFLRMEGEFNFLLFLPKEDREPLHNFWYRDARTSVRDHMIGRRLLEEDTNAIEYQTDDSKREFLLTQRERIYGAAAPQWDLARKGTRGDTLAALQSMMASHGAHNSYLPDTSILNVVGKDSDRYYTLLRNVGHSNIAQPFNESARELPDEDYLTVVPGFIGAYPNYFFQVNENEVATFAGAVSGMASRKDFAALRARFGVPRNVPWFWRVSDKLHAHARAQDPIAFGLFDYNRYRGD